MSAPGASADPFPGEGSRAAASPVILFVPCYVDFFAPEAGIAAVRVLERLGHRVRFRPDVVCCGQPLTNAGCAAKGSAVARRWLDGMAGGGDVIVVSASCAGHLLRERSGGSGDDRGGGEGAGPDDAPPEIHEFCRYLRSRHPGVPLGRLRRTVCLHSSCHGLRQLGVDDDVRELLGRVEGLRVVQAERAAECCGFGGTFSVSFPEISVRMGEDRVEEIRGTGAEEVTATDVSCLAHLRGVSRARGGRLPFRHVAELLAEALELDVSARREAVP